AEASVGSQHAAQIGFVECEEARAELAFGGEAHAVAVIAERLGHAGDHADVADPVGIHEPLGRLDMIVKIALGAARELEPNRLGDALDDLVRRYNFFLTPLTLRVERHELDEAHPDAAFATKARQI